MNDKEQIVVFDTTLRDGEQSPGIEFTPDQKIAIADRLVLMGVDVIEAGFPRNDEDYEATEAVAIGIGSIAARHGVEAPVVCGLARADATDIERCWDAIKYADRARIHTFMGTSAIHMEKKFKVTPDEALSMAVEGVRYAKTFTDDVQFSPEDATRSDSGFMLEVIEAAVENGATTINIPDTTGIITPWEYAELIATTVARARAINPTVVVSAHCHDDLGFATANSMAGIMAGARQVECTMNGIGERAGNADVTEIIANIITRGEFFPVRTRIRSEMFKEFSDMVANFAGYPVAYNKAVIGRNAFAHEAGIHQDGVIKDREIYEALDPARFGQRTTIVDGKHAGRRGKAAIAQGGQRGTIFNGAQVMEI